MNTPTTAHFEIESVDIVDKGCRPVEGVFGFPTVAEQVAPGESSRADRKKTEPCEGIVPDLAGISETMLWSLHNRASERVKFVTAPFAALYELIPQSPPRPEADERLMMEPLVLRR